MTKFVCDSCGADEVITKDNTLPYVNTVALVKLPILYTSKPKVLIDLCPLCLDNLVTHIKSLRQIEKDKTNE